MIRFAYLLLFTFLSYVPIKACSVLYLFDEVSGKIYVINNEDYWYDTKVEIQIKPAKKKKHALLWYGWDDFAQGGVNEHGLFFDGAITPEEEIPDGYQKPKGNLGERILATCKTVEDALALLEKEKVALSNAHMMFGDAKGSAVVVEWVDGSRKLEWIDNNVLIMTNFLLTNPNAGNHPCPRYTAIKSNVERLIKSKDELSLNSVGNTVGNAVQPPRAIEGDKVGGTLYTSFINISDMEFYLVPKLDESRIIQFDLKKEFAKSSGKKIVLK